MEDVYFERIAGVGERKGASPRLPQGATPVEPEGPPVLNMALDDEDLTMVQPDAATPAQPVPQNDVQCDENGFPTSPLRDQEDLWFVQAAALYKPLSKCVGTARTSGMFLIVGGILTVLAGALSVDVVSVVVGVVVTVLGTMERSAGKDLAQAKRSAPLRLAFNQVMVLVLVVVSSWMWVQSVENPKAAQAQERAVSEAELEQMPAAMQSTVRKLVELQNNPRDMAFMMFTVVVALSVLFQGGMAVYYFTRRRKVREFHDELPPWVSEIVTTVAPR